MPAALADGLPFVPCPGIAAVVAAPAAGHHPAPHAAHDRGAAASFEACPFGAIPVAAAPSTPIEPMLPVPDRDPPAAARAPLAIPAPVAGHWRSRAPPVRSPRT
jgi:hypothetical protein